MISVDHVRKRIRPRRISAVFVYWTAWLSSNSTELNVVTEDTKLNCVNYTHQNQTVEVHYDQLPVGQIELIKLYKSFRQMFAVDLN